MDMKEQELKALFEFHSSQYYNVEKFSREMCERLAKKDEYNVKKFNITEQYGIQEMLNDNILDVDNCFYRVFI